MENFDVLIVGAGACGLMCGYILAKAGKRIMVIEARNRLGGRINTMNDNGFSGCFEAGAEFIHGYAPVTIQLLKKAGINYVKTGGKFYRVQQGNWQTENAFEKQWNQLLDELKHLKQDTSIKSFLNEHFPEKKDAAFRESVISMVEGYDAANSDFASALAVCAEWNETDETQYRIKGGYTGLINYLAEKIKSTGSVILCSTPVKQIIWQKGIVEAVTDSEPIKAKKAIITIPLALLQTPDKGKTEIEFIPDIPQIMDAAQQLKAGAVVKIIMQWKDPFWEKEFIKNQKHDHVGFLFSDEFIPTWWTQLPDHIPILTGWLAGPKAEQLKHADDTYIYNKAMDSLASIFSMDISLLKEKLEAYKIINWTADLYSKCGYAYSTVNSTAIKKIISTPIADTLFFGGEALYEGKQMGTVEAALANGEKVAEAVLLAS